MNRIIENKVFGNPGISTKYPEVKQLISGPFSPVISSAQKLIYINSESYIFKDTSFSNTVTITNQSISIPVKQGASWKVWLEVFFENGLATTANYNYNAVWWSGYPLAQDYINPSVAPRSLLTQYVLRIPVFTIAPLKEYAGDGIYFDTNDDSFVVKRHIITDLIIFQSCDGFIFLPSPASFPPSIPSS
jgi:hypothetical protein